MTYVVSDFDLFYLSYDEPQKEQHWATIQNMIPWAKRVDGVKGFDSAHKACAEQSETDRFFTIDGDNILYPEFLDISLNIPDKLADCTLSWASRNNINGLCYGNGGVKLWTKDFVLNMRTHENATRDEEKVDFCWDNKYIQLNNIYSDTCPNGSPFQAFRAGFREGVKMTLDRGVKAGDGTIKKYMHDKNFKRLLIWASVGADVENGLWAIYGTRLGIYYANIKSDFDIANISDYDWFKEYFSAEVASRITANNIVSEIERLDAPLYKDLGLKIALLSPQQSEFFKSVYEAPRRTVNPLVTEIEADRT